MSNEAIVISGAENVKAVQAMARLHFWNLVSSGVQYGFKPPQGYTIKAFNAEYGRNCRRWTQVTDAAIEMIQANRTKPTNRS